ncbi:nuclear transport factor 2 family protein [Nocardia callitridis]|uniref:Nuclear transport factor 2 family protein n=1 Tax=Nocardia callitridis TaxID=648753 RepID=A0ABP9L0Q0_9NOCA
MGSKIRTTIERYVELVGAGSADDVVSLYAADATVEDPVGTPVRKGHDAIREFYELLVPLERETTLHPETVRIAGNSAAFMFTVVTTVNDQRFVLTPIDVMEFDDDGKITGMRALWSQDDMRVDTE